EARSAGDGGGSAPRSRGNRVPGRSAGLARTGFRIVTCEQRSDRRGGQIPLREKADGTTRLDQVAVVALVSRSNQDDLRAEGALSVQNSTSHLDSALLPEVDVDQGPLPPLRGHMPKSDT